jgi:hypothetical protein
MVVVVVGSIGSASPAVDTAKPEQFHALSFHFSINSLVEHYATNYNCVWDKSLPQPTFTTRGKVIAEPRGFISQKLENPIYF